jgi:hypothetical protein
MQARSRFGFLIPCLSIGGLLMLSFFLGAAVVHFELPSSGFLNDAFTGGEALLQQSEMFVSMPTEVQAPINKETDDPLKTCDGFTLYSTSDGAQARLINMRGHVVHEWAAPFSSVWPHAKHVHSLIAEKKIYFFACHLYPNGDLLAVYHGTGDTPYGYGLVKLDKDANVLWTFSENVHHAVDVAEDGTIYVLTHRIIHEVPHGLDISAPALVDDLVRLSPQGEELQRIPVLEAFRDSPFASLLTLRISGSGPLWDVLHTNAVVVLRSSLASHFPLFKEGQVLLSLRELDTLAVVDPEKRAVVWAARGPWQGQHDPHFLDNGHLLLFDNRGSPRQARVLEYDPETQACPWSYSSESSPPFYSPIQGRCQRLANGNTLIVDSKDGVLLEVTADKKLVWSHGCQTHVPWAWRYGPDQVSFLKGAPHARP